MRAFWVIALLTLGLSGCRQQDIRTFELKIPSLTPTNASGLVERIKFNGVVSTTVRTNEQIIVVEYDSMVIAHKNLELAFVENGIEVNGIKPVVKPAAPGAKP